MRSVRHPDSLAGGSRFSVSPPWALATPLILVGVALFVIPVALVVTASVEGENALEQYGAFLTSGYHLQILLRTVLLSVVSVLITALLSFPFAYFLATRSSRIAALCVIALFLPMLVNAVVRIFGIQVFLRSLNNLLGLVGLPALPTAYNENAVVIAFVMFLFPYMTLPIFASLSHMNLSIVEAARTLGAGAGAVMARVVLPSARPGLIAGSVMCFALASGSFIVPAMMGGGRVQTMPLLVYNAVATASNFAFAAATAMILLVVVLPTIVYTSTHAEGKERG